MRNIHTTCDLGGLLVGAHPLIRRIGCDCDPRRPGSWDRISVMFPLVGGLLQLIEASLCSAGCGWWLVLIFGDALCLNLCGCLVIYSCSYLSLV